MQSTARQTREMKCPRTFYTVVYTTAADNSLSTKTQIPPDLVVAQEASELESRSRLDVL